MPRVTQVVAAPDGFMNVELSAFINDNSPVRSEEDLRHRRPRRANTSVVQGGPPPTSGPSANNASTTPQERMLYKMISVASSVSFAILMFILKRVAPQKVADGVELASSFVKAGWEIVGLRQQPRWLFWRDVATVPNDVERQLSSLRDTDNDYEPGPD